MYDNGICKYFKAIKLKGGYNNGKVRLIDNKDKENTNNLCCERMIKVGKGGKNEDNNERGK